MIQFENVSKSVGGVAVLTGVTFEVPTGELVVMAGPSGCGKTTTLKMINRLIAPTSGRVLIDGEDVARQQVLALRRGMGYVTQHTGLFEHLTVRQNLAVVLELEHWEEAAVARRIGELAELFSLPEGDFLDRVSLSADPPAKRQRVCIARAFAADPDVLLMDDPFAAWSPASAARCRTSSSPCRRCCARRWSLSPARWRRR